MFDRFLSGTRPQFTTVTRLAGRDLPLQLSTGLLMCVLCWTAGSPVVAIGIALWLVIAEGVVIQLKQQKPPFTSFDREQTLSWLFFFCTANTLMYASPALFLAAAPSLAMKFTAILWLAGIQTYIINTWSRVPAFLFPMLSVTMIILAMTFLRLSASPPEPSSTLQWVIACACLIIYIYATIDVLRQHMATETELAAAQSDADSRLAQLEEAYRLDTLTGLLNRPAFDRALDLMLRECTQDGINVAVMVLDLDRFKPINDTYSHAAGDGVLQETARRLTRLIATDGIVARLGGDEFVCALPITEDLPDPLDIGRDLQLALSAPIQWDTRLLSTTASVGIAVSDSTGQDAPLNSVSGLCSAADQAMFVAKSAPSGRPVVFEASKFAARMTPEDKRSLVEAITNRDVRPFYQPKIHLPSGQIIGFEALARWEHPRLGLQAPGLFVDQITELGLQGDFMISIARQVIEDVDAMLDMGLDPGQVSINVSEVALATHNGREELNQIVGEYPHVGQYLTFEITEDVFIARASGTIQASIASFREYGVRISLDDFGTGFASFHHLRQLDFDELKIDTSFVGGLGIDPAAEVLVRGFLDIASGIGVSVVAEGVETDAQRRDLINMGCMTAQGYLFSPAVPLTRAIDLLRDQQAA